MWQFFSKEGGIFYYLGVKYFSIFLESYLLGQDLWPFCIGNRDVVTRSGISLQI